MLLKKVYKNNVYYQQHFYLIINISVYIKINYLWQLISYYKKHILIMVKYMRISELQTKEVVNQNDGRNIGKIIDMDILENGTINYFVVEPRKILKKFNIYNNETSVKLNQIVKIGEDVILVDLK